MLAFGQIENIEQIGSVTFILAGFGYIVCINDFDRFSVD